MDLGQLRCRRRQGRERGGIVRLARIVHDDLFAGPLRRDLIRDRLAFEELGWQGLADYVDYPPPGSSLRDAIDRQAERERDDDGWKLGDHLGAVQIDKLNELIWFFRRAYFEGKPDFPAPIPRPGAETDPPAPVWSDEKIAAMVPGMAAVLSN